MIIGDRHRAVSSTFNSVVAVGRFGVDGGKTQVSFFFIQKWFGVVVFRYSEFIAHVHVSKGVSGNLLFSRRSVFFLIVVVSFWIDVVSHVGCVSRQTDEQMRQWSMHLLEEGAGVRLAIGLEWFVWIGHGIRVSGVALAWIFIIGLVLRGACDET